MGEWISCLFVFLRRLSAVLQSTPWETLTKLHGERWVTSASKRSRIYNERLDLLHCKFQIEVKLPIEYVSEYYWQLAASLRQRADTALVSKSGWLPQPKIPYFFRSRSQSPALHFFLAAAELVKRVQTLLTSCYSPPFPTFPPLCNRICHASASCGLLPPLRELSHRCMLMPCPQAPQFQLDRRERHSQKQTMLFSLHTFLQLLVRVYL